MSYATETEVADPFDFGEQGGAPQVPYAGAVQVPRGVDGSGRPVTDMYVVMQRASGHYRVAAGSLPLTVPLAKGRWVAGRLIVTSAPEDWGLPRIFRMLR